MSTSVSRRTVARGSVWAIPAVLMATSAPAAAASPREASGCGLVNWTQSSTSGSTRTYTLTTSNGVKVTMTATQRRLSGRPAVSPLNNVSYDFVASPAGSQAAYSNFKVQSQGADYTVSGETTSVLTLNQGTAVSGVNARQDVVLSFTVDGRAVTPKSIMFNAYDITSQVTNMNQRAYYTDKLSVSGAMMTTSNPTGAPLAYVTTSTSVASTGTNVSTKRGNSVTVQLAPTSSVVTLTYENSNYATPRDPNANYQYIGIGDLTVCF